MTVPLIVVRRKYYDLFAAGEKTIEYRRIRGAFNERVYCPGRKVRLAYNYNLSRFPFLLATVIRFDGVRAGSVAEMMEIDPRISPDEIIAAIHLDIDR